MTDTRTSGLIDITPEALERINVYVSVDPKSFGLRVVDGVVVPKEMAEQMISVLDVFEKLAVAARESGLLSTAQEGEGNG